MKTQDYLKKCFNEKSDIEHAKQVEKLAIMLFDKLSTIFDDTRAIAPAANLLKISALLHDIGAGPKLFSVEKPHNKTGAKFVMENGIDGLKATENLIVANLIRYHRGKNPEEKHKLFSKLDVDSKQLVLVFASILRIADALDCNHFSLIENIETQFLPDKQKLLLKLTPKLSYSAGFDQIFKKKKKLFEEVFGVDVELV